MKFIFLFFIINLVLNSPSYYQQNKIYEVEKSVLQRKDYIRNASKLFGINTRSSAVIIFTERYLNHKWLDDELDFLLLKVGLNASVGFCQIKFETADWIERQLNWSKSHYYLGKEITKIISLISKNREELINKLCNDSINIVYAAAFIKMNIERWKKEGIDISANIAILGTLYSNGARKPNNKMKPNNFGLKLDEFYYDKRVLKWFDR